MGNNTQNSNLDETVKQTLKNYEGGYDPADWSRMEKMLDSATPPSTFRWKYLLNGFIGLAVCAAGYLAYSAFTSGNSEQKNEAQNEITAPPVKTPSGIPVTPAPTVTYTTTTEIAPSTPSAPLPVTASAADVKNEKNENVVSEKSRRRSSQAADSSEDLNRNVRVLGMGNEPVFGDMLDSSKGIVGETKEKKETRDAAKKNKGLPVGWNSFMLSNVNPDSIKAYRERLKAAADSTSDH